MGYGLGWGLRLGLGVVCGLGLALCVVTCEKDSRMQKSWRSNPPSLAQFQGSRISDQNKTKITTKTKAKNNSKKNSKKQKQ